MERISVIVPIYKVEAYLDRCIQSIVAQTYQNMEIILVDDGSPDNCPAICDAWAEKDSRIRVIHQENGGLSDARNAGLEIATGEYIAFVDSDDSIHPDFLERLYQALTEQGADVAECAVNYVDEAGNILRQRSAAEVAAMDKLEALRRLVLEDGVYQTVWNKLYRRGVIEDIPFEKGKLNEDEFWTYRVFDRIEKLAVVQKPLYHYLQRGGSIIGTGYNICRLDGLEARFQRMQYLQKYDELAALTRQSLMLDCMWHYQCALRELSAGEKQNAISKIKAMMTALRRFGNAEAAVATGKTRVWLLAFQYAPEVTARVRNILKIGV